MNWLWWLTLIGLLAVAAGAKLLHCGHKRERDCHHGQGHP